MADTVDISQMAGGSHVSHSSLTGGQIALTVMYQVAREAKLPDAELESWLHRPHARLKNATPAEFLDKQPLIVLDLAEDDLQLSV